MCHRSSIVFTVYYLILSLWQFINRFFDKTIRRTPGDLYMDHTPSLVPLSRESDV